MVRICAIVEDHEICKIPHSQMVAGPLGKIDLFSRQNLHFMIFDILFDLSQKLPFPFLIFLENIQHVTTPILLDEISSSPKHQKIVLVGDLIVLGERMGLAVYVEVGAGDA
jgi:hypothetical protein